MRRPILRTSLLLPVAALTVLAACDRKIFAESAEPEGVNIIDEANLTDLLLTAGDPNEGIAYFQGALANDPERVDFRRGLAISLTRAKRYPEAARVYEEMITLNQAAPTDRLDYALVAARLDKWQDVRAVVAALPPGLNTGRRHMVEAMLADSEQNWTAADAAYARAETLSTNPASVLNNWGVSLMSRGDLPAAQNTFSRALTYNGRLFSAKNNLAIVRGLQGIYQLPVVPMTETEKAIILNNLGVIALRRGQQKIAKGLFAAAVEAHPQHYGAAATRLAALEAVVEN